MAASIPYTYFQCPCISENPPSTRKAGEPLLSEDSDEDEDDNDFDPRAPRSNYSLHPLEHLLYCEDCQQIRCPRCVLDEIVTWYCPNCLFEVPSSTVKSEGNRYVDLMFILAYNTDEYHLDAQEVAFSALYVQHPSLSIVSKLYLQGRC
jgi:hypothetical protein